MKTQFLYIILFCISASLLHSVHSETVTISNSQPRRDINGNIMDMHDGNTIFVDGVYYWYAASYGNCTEQPGVIGCNTSVPQICGFQTNHSVSLFTSTNMKDWTPRGTMFAATSHPFPIILFCPKVIHNKIFNYYVLWYNWILFANNSYFWNVSAYAVAISSTPYGPFHLQNHNASIAYQDAGDFGLFSDSDGQGFIVYTKNLTEPGVLGHNLVVEQLDPSFMSGKGLASTSAVFPGGYVEAPIMFRRGDLYYVMTGPCCCYCSNALPVIAYAAKYPLGPYALVATNISAVSRAQETSVVPVYTNKGVVYVWQGDRWQQAPDKIKGHDPQYWSPLVFNESGGIEEMTYLPEFTLDMP